MSKILYEQPMLKNYGTMKDLTFRSGGSGADSFGAGNSPPRGGDPKPLILNYANTNLGDVGSDTSTDFATIYNNDK